MPTIFKARVFHHAAAMILFDTAGAAAHPGRRAPWGKWPAFDWELCRKAAISGKFMLSGGLDPVNVGQRHCADRGGDRRCPPASSERAPRL